MECCAKCVFWDQKYKRVQENVGEIDKNKKRVVVASCRRNSPRVFNVNNKLVSIFPVTSSKEWCGEFISVDAYVDDDNASD